MIKNIIFDLGNVIINIDFDLTTNAFATLAGISPAESLAILTTNEVYQKIETGTLSESEFRDFIRGIFAQPHWSDQTIDQAWNALLLDIPADRIDLLRRLTTKYRLFLLSNTSSIHLREVYAILERATGVKNLDELLETVFLSYEMGVMKPHAQIYEMVLAQADLKADETLFLDDLAANVEAANALGVHTIQVQKTTSIVEYLRDY